MHVLAIRNIIAVIKTGTEWCQYQTRRECDRDNHDTLLSQWMSLNGFEQVQILDNSKFVVCGSSSLACKILIWGVYELVEKISEWLIASLYQQCKNTQLKQCNYELKQHFQITRDRHIKVGMESSTANPVNSLRNYAAWWHGDPLVIVRASNVWSCIRLLQKSLLNVCWWSWYPTVWQLEGEDCTNYFWCHWSHLTLPNTTTKQYTTICGWSNDFNIVNL